MNDKRARVSEALTKVMYGYDGLLLTGDFWPGHEAIVDAVMNALEPKPGDWIEHKGGACPLAEKIGDSEEFSEVAIDLRFDGNDFYGDIEVNENNEVLDTCAYLWQWEWEDSNPKITHYRIRP